MITGSLALTKFKHAKCSMNGADGKPRKGMFIPFEANNLEEHQNGEVYFNIVGFENKTPQTFSTHMVKQSFKKEVREAMSEEERNSQPIFGNLNANSTHTAQINTDPNLTGTPQTTPAIGTSSNDDDLPF